MSNEKEIKENKGIYDPRNKLNELTGKEWLKFTNSWKVYRPPPRTSLQLQHPAKFPESLAIDFISFFTKQQQLVVDPFLGTGTTAKACGFLNRRFIGIELNKEYCNIIKESIAQKNINSLGTQCKIINADTRNIVSIWKKKELPLIDYILTSPPYWNVLRKSGGNSESSHTDRKEKGLPLFYSENEKDLGNIEEYDSFMRELCRIFYNIYDLMKPLSYITIVVQNIYRKEGMKPLAFELTLVLEERFQFISDKLWLQNDKKLGIWGYPFEYYPNITHHYCLTFRKRND